MDNLVAIVYPAQPRATVERVQPEVAQFGDKLLQTSLSNGAEAKLQAMLNEANTST